MSMQHNERQWRVYGFTIKSYEVLEGVGKSLLTLKNKWVHSFNSSLNRKARYSHIQPCQANTLTEVLLISISPENPEPHLHFLLNPSPGCTVRKAHLIYWVTPGSPNTHPVHRVEAAGPSTTHVLFLCESRYVLYLGAHFIYMLCYQSSLNEPSYIHVGLQDQLCCAMFLFVKNVLYGKEH